MGRTAVLHMPTSDGGYPPPATSQKDGCRCAGVPPTLSGIGGQRPIIHRLHHCGAAIRRPRLQAPGRPATMFPSPGFVAVRPGAGHQGSLPVMWPRGRHVTAGARQKAGRHGFHLSGSPAHSAPSPPHVIQCQTCAGLNRPRAPHHNSGVPADGRPGGSPGLSEMAVEGRPVPAGSFNQTLD